MKFRSVLAIILAFVLLLSGCTSSVNVKEDDNNKSKKEKEVFTYTYENLFTEGDIQPVQEVLTGEIHVFGVSEYTNGDDSYLIDYTGKKVADITGDYNFCSLCAEYGDHMNALDPETFVSISANGGHGGGPYTLYDAERGEKYSMTFGYSTLVEGDIEYEVCALAQRREASADEAEFTGQDFAYDFLNEYALIIDNELVARGFEHAVEYDPNGIAALCKNGKWGYYNSKGEEILGFEYSPSVNTFYDYASSTTITIPYSSSCGYIAINKNGMWGYADLEGNLVTDFIFEEARPVYMGKAWVKINGAWSVIAFSEYDTGITMEEARKRVVEYSGMNSYNISLFKTDYKFYGSNAYIYKAEQGSTLNYYIVLYDSTVYVKYSN